LKSKGLKISERRISIDEVVKAAETGALKEVFGTGTAAVISPVGSLTYKDKTYNIGDFKVGEYTQKLYDELTAIQWGEIPDKFNWIVKIN
jgi:branched-chain amino acid aminotransferase